MANEPGPYRQNQQRPAGKRFRRDPASAGRRPAPRPRPASGGARFAEPQPARRGAPSRQSGVRPGPYGGQPKRTSPLVVIAAILLAVGVVAGVSLFVFPRLFGPDSHAVVEPGQRVELTIPDGASGDVIAGLLSENHVIEDPADYYAAVKRLGAETSLKPGDYAFETGQDPIDVVKQLVEGPNLAGVRLVVPEGLTVAQTAELVEQTYSIPADEFIAQAKASNYIEDYPFLDGTHDDSLEGFLYPKTYDLGSEPSCDKIIRAMLDQFELEVVESGLYGDAHGLSAYQVLTMASLVERETAVVDERPLVASVIQNRLDADMLLQIDAAIVYARGGGSQGVSYDDLKIDSPYNVYVNKGLTPGPICSPSVSSIEAASDPADTDYLYYVASAAGDGTHKFTNSYEEFERFRQEYTESIS